MSNIKKTAGAVFFMLLITYHLSGTGCISPVVICSKTVGKNITSIK